MARPTKRISTLDELENSAQLSLFGDKALDGVVELPSMHNSLTTETKIMARGKKTTD